MLTGIHFYNQTVKKAVSVFGTLFNNIKIVKPGKAEIRVPIAYGPAQKFLTRLQDAGADTDRIALKLPRMSFEINSMEYDAERALNKMNKVTSSRGETSNKTVFQGAPYNIGFTLTLIGKDQDSVLQILEQILPTFRPEYTISIKDMITTGKSMDVPVILNSVTLEDDYEGDYTSRRVITYALDFTMKVNFVGSVVDSVIIKTAETYLHNSPATIDIANSNSPISGIKVISETRPPTTNWSGARVGGSTTFTYSTHTPSSLSPRRITVSGLTSQNTYYGGVYKQVDTLVNGKKTFTKEASTFADNNLDLNNRFQWNGSNWILFDTLGGTVIATATSAESPNAFTATTTFGFTNLSPSR